MSTCLIKTKNLIKRFNGVTVVKDLSLEIKKGTMVILKGSNGSGKTTLLKLFLGVYLPSSGSISRYFKKYFYLEESLIIKNDIKVATYLRLVLALMKEKRNETLENLFMLELNKPLKSLSKGNLKKILLYLAFVGNPEIVFFDEPFDGLDVAMQKIVINYMQSRSEITYIIATHNLRRFSKFSNKEVIEFD